MSIENYLELVAAAYKNRGGLDHQREALKTTTAKRIRARMVSDIINGAVLPPIVIGAVVDKDELAQVNQQAIEKTLSLVSEHYAGQLSIIDGMQRTTAIIEALKASEEKIKDRTLRVEFWISDSTESLIYRMLVLNTGQVPWNLSRQLQVVYSPLIEEIRRSVKFERILDVNKGERRTKAGEYGPDNLAELYIAFGLRKTDIDAQETLADEFSRLDMTEALASHQYRDFFYPSVQMMVDLDQAFSRFDVEIEAAVKNDGAQKNLGVRKGRSIFDSKPARIGFIVAVATTVLGRVGMKKDEDAEASAERLNSIRTGVDALLKKLNAMNYDELINFLKLEMLSERLSGQKRAAVGRHERAFFDTAFRVLIDEVFAVPSMEPCWRA